MLTEGNLISFRLPKDLIALLAVHQVEDESLSKAAQRLFCGHLQRQQELDILNENFTELSRQIEELRGLLLRAAEGIVVATGRVTPDRAKEWIETKVCPRSQNP